MKAIDQLAGTKLLSRQLSISERAAADFAMTKALQRDYEIWLMGLPISKADQALIRTIDRVRQQLLAGKGIGKQLKSALQKFETRAMREKQELLLRVVVDSLHRGGLKKSLKPKNGGAGAFEKAVEPGLFGFDLSVEKAVKIYYKKEKLPKSKKKR